MTISFTALHRLIFSLILLSLVFLGGSNGVFAATCGGDGQPSCEDADTENAGSNTVTDVTIQLREPLLPGEENKTVTGKSNDAFGILSQYVSMIYRYVLALSSIIAVLVVMFAGFQLMISGGDSEARTTAKTMIMKTLSGIAMLFLVGLFLYAINPNFYMFTDSEASSESGTESSETVTEGQTN